MDEQDEIYTPWKVTRRTSTKPVAEMHFVVYDDNGNPMAYAEDDFFLTTAIKIINDHDDLAARLEATAAQRDGLAALVSDLVNVAQWYTSFYHDVENTAPEYFERCGDLNATQYLYSEAQSIRGRVAALVPALVKAGRE